MRRTGALIVGLAIAASVHATAVAQTPVGDSVVGSGTARFASPDLAGLIAPFSIDVRSGPSGEDPVGSLQLIIAFDDPTCLAIRSGGGQVADEAVINFRNTLNGARVLVRIAGGTSGPREIWLSTASSASDCSFVPPISFAEVIEGSISIFDAPPLPTTNQQCRNGGWRSFGIFRSQGDCVSLVATKGKNQPSGP
jgi:hypothetical protein